MKVSDLLIAKGSDVVSMEKEGTVEDAIRTMHNRKISAVLVTENGKPAGIFTERDVVRSYINSGGKPFSGIPLKDAMTVDLIVAQPQDELANISSVMIQKKIRHLPVSEKGKIIGMLSIRDVIQSQIDTLTEEIHYLKDCLADQ
ncbi:MAG: CBS domain-containing protein [Thermodesulfovibrionales bacterium]|jgi:CBS domain-containing protein